jgi:hypothetical protein
MFSWRRIYPILQLPGGLFKRPLQGPEFLQFCRADTLTGHTFRVEFLADGREHFCVADLALRQHRQPVAVHPAGCRIYRIPLSFQIAFFSLEGFTRFIDANLGRVGVELLADL